MNDNVNKCVYELVNLVFRNKFGEDLIVNNKLNYSAMGVAANTFMNKDKVNVEIRKSSQLEGSDYDIEFEKTQKELEFKNIIPFDDKKVA